MTTTSPLLTLSSTRPGLSSWPKQSLALPWDIARTSCEVVCEACENDLGTIDRVISWGCWGWRTHMEVAATVHGVPPLRLHDADRTQVAFDLAGRDIMGECRLVD